MMRSFDTIPQKGKINSSVLGISIANHPSFSDFLLLSSQHYKTNAL